MAPFARLAGTTLDCADPVASSGFYRSMTGWSVGFESPDYVFLLLPGSGKGSEVGIGFQRVEGYQPPTWPERDAAARAHLDFHVDDYAAAERQLVELGATRAEYQPGEGRWHVFLDPAGHPFCVVERKPSGDDPVETS